MKTKILIVDDEKAQREMLSGFLAKQGYDTCIAEGGHRALDKYPEFFAPLALVDMRMPDIGGLELLARLRELNPFVQVVVLTAFGTVENAVDAMKAGAFSYLTKPVNLDELLVTLQSAMDKHRLVVDNDLLRRTMEDLAELPEMIGQSEQLNSVRQLIARVAPSDSTVLITGPSGSGKELVAKAVHELSNRKDNPFIPINCAAFPETLLESELFGHEKGAFTGADRNRSGRFELADGGTIFLDEIGDMPDIMQAKLLRVLEDGRIEPLGSTSARTVDVRVLSATNRDLKQLIEEGRFREDLFYRINTVRIDLPPLRDRGGDVLLLADYFIKKFAGKSGKKIEGLSARAATLLNEYTWPGNIRELQHLIERAVVLTIDEILDVDDFPGLDKSGEKSKSYHTGGGTSLADVEKRHIEDILTRHDWNMQKAADILGIHRNTLRQKIKDYKLKRPGR
jgi:DNA-binding NtrC family response regulator